MGQVYILVVLNHLLLDQLWILVVECLSVFALVSPLYLARFSTHTRGGVGFWILWPARDPETSCTRWCDQGEESGKENTDLTETN
jgi:hypothetical protein